LESFAASILPEEFSGNADLQALSLQFANNRFMTRAPSTISKHAAQWRTFRDWLATKLQNPAVTILDVENEPWLVALYLTDVHSDCTMRSLGPSKVMAASAAIACYFWLHGKQSPTAHPLCDLAREAARRSLVPNPISRDPVTADNLRLLIDRFAGPSASLRDLMHVTVLTLMYTGFLRFDDAATISVHHQLLVIHPGSHVDIFLARSKTDQLMAGAWVTIAATGTPYCPVALLQRLLQLGQYVTVPRHLLEDVGPLLRALAPGGMALRQVASTIDRPIPAASHATLLDHCREMFAAVGVHSAITLHSFRIGGATAAAAAGVPDRLFKKHGRWRTDEAKDRYVREHLQEKLEVSRALGL
jgi:hypothetical protein